MKKLLWVLMGLVLVIGVAGLVLMTGKQPEPFADGTQSAVRLQPGPMGVQRYDHTFVDESRSTDANGDYGGDTVRTLEGSVWYPADETDGPYPLLVYSHGFSGMRSEAAYLGDLLASLGYILVAVDYPLTNIDAPGGPQVRDVVNQPGDVSFLIDSLLEQGRTSGHPLQGLVDEERIGVTGLSLGGMTTALVSYHPTMRDPRIRAALSIAGPTAIFTDVFFTHADLPFLMLAGDIDALVPYATNAAPVPERVSNSQLVTIVGGSHTGFAGPAAPLRWMNNPDALGCWMVERSFDSENEDPWFDLIGTEEQGIDHHASDELCQLEPLPPAMNILRQLMISSVVVSSFFESQFAPDAARRESASEFLSATLPAELSEVSYQRAPAGAGTAEPVAQSEQGSLEVSE